MWKNRQVFNEFNEYKTNIPQARPVRSSRIPCLDHVYFKAIKKQKEKTKRIQTHWKMILLMGNQKVMLNNIQGISTVIFFMTNIPVFDISQDLGFIACIE